MFDFAARENNDFKGIVAKKIAANFAILMKTVEVSLNDVKGELYGAYCLKHLELSKCIACFSVQIALGLRFQIIAKNL